MTTPEAVSNVRAIAKMIDVGIDTQKWFIVKEATRELKDVANLIEESIVYEAAIKEQRQQCEGK